MKRRTFFHRLAFAAVFSTALLLTAAAQGDVNDPLVTLGYLTEQFLPQVVEQVEVKAAGRDAALEAKVQELLDAHAAEMEEKINKLSSGGGAAAPGFAVVHLAAGQKLTLTVGGELLLRSGSAVCFAPSSPGLVDTTAGESLESGGALGVNHLYLATDNGRGLTASDDVTVLVRGSYLLE